jgi:putative two-component system response regulator
MTIVDIYDALTFRRSYRNASPPEEALGIIEQEVRKGWRDPYIFAEFQNLLATSLRTGD